MKVTVTFRHMDATEAIKNHVEDKVEKFKKYLASPIDVHVVLSVEKFRQQCEITLHTREFNAIAIDASENLYTSIDTAVHKMERQIKKHKEIIKHHKDHVPLHETSAIAEDEYYRDVTE